MKMNRRNVLVGLGTIVAGGGAALGTGAFTSVEADRTVSVQTAGDASAFLSLSPARAAGEYVDDSGDAIEIVLDGSSSADGSGLNENAVSRFEDLVTVTNQGTQVIDSLSFEFSYGGTDLASVQTLQITSGDATIDADGSGTDLLTESTAGDASTDPTGQLDAGQSVPFGVQVDLTTADDGPALDDAGAITLTITAETA